MEITIDDQEYRVTQASSATSETFFVTERKRGGVWRQFLGRGDNPRTLRLFDSEEEAKSAIREWHSYLKHINGGFL